MVNMHMTTYLKSQAVRRMKIEVTRQCFIPIVLEKWKRAIASIASG